MAAIRPLTDMQIVGCPQCEAPAELQSAGSLPSTSGPVPHVRVWCSAGHRFLMPRDGLDCPTPVDGLIDAETYRIVRRLAVEQHQPIHDVLRDAVQHYLEAS
jgi:hypothetical protein